MTDNHHRAWPLWFAWVLLELLWVTAVVAHDSGRHVFLAAAFVEWSIAMTWGMPND